MRRTERVSYIDCLNIVMTRHATHTHTATQTPVMCMQNSHQALRSEADGVEDGEEGGNVAEEHEVVL